MIQKTTNPSAVSARLAAHPLYASCAALLAHLHGVLPNTSAAVGLTSAHAGEGVSTVAANLAICAARTMQLPVLLVEAHVQASPLAHRFGAASYPGWSDLLGTRAELEDCLRRTNVEHLTLLTAGTQGIAGTQAHQAIDSAALAALVEQLKHRFAFLVFDLAPITESHPSAALAGRLDGVLLVVEAGKAQIEAVESTRNRLTQAEVRLLGLVLNKRVRQVPAWLEM